jgi:hypothetical protein
MKNENFYHDSLSNFFWSDSVFYESGNYKNDDEYCKIKEEINQFVLNLNQCKICRSIHSQIHFLHMSLIHLDNLEIEFITSNLSDEVLYQEKIIEDIHSLKLMVLNHIRDLSEESNN